MSQVAVRIDDDMQKVCFCVATTWLDLGYASETNIYDMNIFSTLILMWVLVWQRSESPVSINMTQHDAIFAFVEIHNGRCFDGYSSDK